MFGVLFLILVVSGSDERHDPLRRILGGYKSSISEFPYAAYLRPAFANGVYLYATSCGCSIINTYNVLTAAHCVVSLYEGYHLQSAYVRVGSTHALSGGQKIWVLKTFIHPTFSISMMRNDIAVLRLTEPIIYTSNVLPIKMAMETPPDRTELTVLGWGAAVSGGPSKHYLYATEVPKANLFECILEYSGSGMPVYNTSICAGYRHGGHDACNGDSGGPLLYNDIQVGITSWGDGCGERFGVYTDVSKYTWFILQALLA